MNTKNKISIYWNMAIFAVFTIMVFMLPELGAAAAGDSTLNKILCKGNQIVQSDAGKAIAIAAIIIMGLSALLGKISWGMGIMVVLGIALIFGAQSIMTEFTDATGADCG